MTHDGPVEYTLLQSLWYSGGHCGMVKLTTIAITINRMGLSPKKTAVTSLNPAHIPQKTVL